MQLTPEQKQIIMSAIDTKMTTQPSCPITGDKKWQLQEQLAYMPTLPGVVNGPLFPNAVLICTTCGYTLLLNLFILGVAEQLDIQPAKQ